MPKGPIPTSHLDLLDAPVLGHLSTVDHYCRPQVNPVWFLWDSSQLLLSIKPETIKYRNLRKNPAVAISILDPTNSFRYLELRGTVAEFELYTTLEFVNQLARKYTNSDFTGGQHGEERYKVTVQIDSWTANGR